MAARNSARLATGRVGAPAKVGSCNWMSTSGLDMVVSFQSWLVVSACGDADDGNVDRDGQSSDGLFDPDGKLRL